MFPRVPKLVIENVLYAPLLDVLDGQFITSRELAERWRYSEDHLANLRRAGKGPRFVKLRDTGAVRYYLSDVIAAELEGTAGRLEIDDVLTAIASCPKVAPEVRETLLRHVRSALEARKARK